MVTTHVCYLPATRLPNATSGSPSLRRSMDAPLETSCYGALGGRKGRHARQLAERLVSAGDTPSTDLRRAVADPAAFALSTASYARVMAILVLMVWRPT